MNDRGDRVWTTGITRYERQGVNNSRADSLLAAGGRGEVGGLLTVKCDCSFDRFCISDGASLETCTPTENKYTQTLNLQATEALIFSL